MKGKTKTSSKRDKSVEKLKQQLVEAEETLNAIRLGLVDALVVTGPRGDQVYTLKGADQAYRIFLETMSEGAATLKPDGTLLYSNSRLARLLGAPLERIQGSPLRAYVDEANWPLVQSLLSEALTGSSRGETRLRGVDGNSIPVYLAFTYLEEDGAPAFSLIVTDLTEQKASQQVSAAERLARSILEQAAEAMIVCDLDGRIIRANGAARDLAGREMSHEIFDQAIDLYPPGHSPRAAEPGLPLAVAGVALRGETLKNVEADWVTPSGTIRNLLLAAGPLRNAEGEVIGCTITLNDATERIAAEKALAESEERFRQLAENIGAGFWILEMPDRRISYLSPAFERLWGFDTSIRDRRVWSDYIYPADLPRVSAAFVERASAGTYDEEYRMRLPDGSLRWVRDRAFPILDRAGNVRRIAGILEDITDLKRARLELESINGLLRAVLESTSDAIYAKDDKGRYLISNSAAARASGRPVHQVIGRTDAELLPPELAARFEEEDRLVLSRDEPVSVEYDVFERGTPRRYHTIKTPFVDTHGNLLGVVGVGRDVTEQRELLRREQDARQELEATLRQLSESEAKLKRLASSNVIGIIEGEGETIHRANQAFLDIVASSLDEEDSSRMNWVQLTPPGYEEKDGWALHEMLERGACTPFEKEYLRPDGTKVPVLVGGAALSREPFSWISFVLDLSEQKRAEREREQLLVKEQVARLEAEDARSRFAFLAEASSILSSSLDYETTLGNVADLAIRQLADWCIIQITAPDGKLNTPIIRHKDPASVELLREFLERHPGSPGSPTGVPRAIRTGISELYSDIQEEDLRTADRPQEEIQLAREIGLRSAMVVPLNARGRTIGAISLMSAQPDRHYTPEDLELAEELARRAAMAMDNARLYQEAQTAIRIRDQFFTIASHELKTPLTTMMGYAEMFSRIAEEKQDHFDEREKRAITTISHQTQRLNRMISALLDVSRIESGQLRLDIAPLDLTQIVRQVARDAEQGLRHHTIRLDADGPLPVAGDELRLEQALENLIQNAVKYSPGGREVRVKAERRGSMAVVSIEDEGLGIPRESFPNLFERFYRAPNADSWHIPGMGIGLYVVREIVNLHGGTVSVESELDHGSRFTLSLPLRAEEPRDQNA